MSWSENSITLPDGEGKISLNTGEVIIIDDLVSVDSSHFDKITL